MQITIKELVHYCHKIIAKLKREKLKELQTNFYMAIGTEHWDNVQSIKNPEIYVGSVYDEIEFIQSVLNDSDGIFPIMYFDYVAAILKAISYERNPANKELSQKTFFMPFQNKKMQITTAQLVMCFKKMMDVLRESDTMEINILTDRYIFIPASRWDPCQYIDNPLPDVGSLHQEITALRRLYKPNNAPCTFEDFNRVSHVFMAIREVLCPS